MHPNTLRTLLENAAVNVEVARDALGLGRNLAYAGVESGEIPNFRVGGRVMVPTAPLLRKLGIDPVEALAMLEALKAAAAPTPLSSPPHVKPDPAKRPARHQRTRTVPKPKGKRDQSAAMQGEANRTQAAQE